LTKYEKEHRGSFLPRSITDFTVARPGVTELPENGGNRGNQTMRIFVFRHKFPLFLSLRSGKTWEAACCAVGHFWTALHTLMSGMNPAKYSTDVRFPRPTGGINARASCMGCPEWQPMT